MSTFSSVVWAQEMGGGAGAAPAVGTGGMIASFLPFALIFIVFYFLLILPQQRKQKKHRAMLEALKKGDRVLTTGGIMASVVAINNNVITLQVAENVRIKTRREYIAELLEGPEEGA